MKETQALPFMLCTRALALAVLLAVGERSCVHAQSADSDSATSDGSEEVDRGESASFDVRCDVCRSLLADLSAVAESVRQQLHADGTTGGGTTVAETTTKTITGMCSRREPVPRLLGLYKLHDCDSDDAVKPGQLDADESVIGALVSLADGYEDHGDAADGPLLPGQTATLKLVTEDKLMVTTASGKNWWYKHPAVMLVRSPACAQVKPPQRYTAEHYTDVSPELIQARTDSGAVRAWEVHAHRMMCLRYWNPLAEDIGDIVADGSVITADAAALEFCVDKGLCKEEHGQRHRSKARHQKKRARTRTSGSLGTRSDDL